MVHDIKLLKMELKVNFKLLKIKDNTLQFDHMIF